MKRASLFFTLLLPLSILADEHHLALDELVVQGSQLEETLPSELADYGAELEVIDSEELDRTGVSDVGQALQGSVPGLYLNPKTGRGDYSDVHIQGSRSKDVLWLVDGVRINNRLYSSTSPLDSISTHMIERIEVLKGGQGLFYGTQAVAGVVNIVLRDPANEPGGNVTGAVGSLGDRRLATRVSDGNEFGRWLVFGEHDHSDGYRPYPDDAYQASARRVDRGFSRRSVGGRYVLDAGKGKSLNALFIRNDVEADYPRAVENFKSVNDRDEHIASIKWDHQVTEQAGYYIKAYYHDWWTDYTRLSMDDDRNVTILNDRDEWGYDDYGINLTGRYTFNDGSQLLGGVDYQDYEGKDYVLRIDGKSESVTAGFLQFRPELPFSPSTRLAIGTRYSAPKYGTNNSIWNVSLGQPLAYGLDLKASVGTNFRLPSAYELFVIEDDIVGNPNLEPEESLNSNLSITGPIGSIANWQLGGFYREIENLIATDAESDTFVNTNNTVRVRGAEIVLNVGGDRGWQFDANATYSEARKDGSEEQIEGIPEWFANATLAWDGVATGWQVQARYTGDNAKTLADFGRQEYGDYTVIDASLWHRFGHDRRNRITLRVNNLADREYASTLDQAKRDGSPYQYETLGPPRNAQLEYSRDF
jgi:vitamin B12 transporter